MHFFPLQKDTFSSKAGSTSYVKPIAEVACLIPLGSH